MPLSLVLSSKISSQILSQIGKIRHTATTKYPSGRTFSALIHNLILLAEGTFPFRVQSCCCCVHSHSTTTYHVRLATNRLSSPFTKKKAALEAAPDYCSRTSPYLSLQGSTFGDSGLLILLTSCKELQGVRITCLSSSMQSIISHILLCTFFSLILGH